MTIRQNNLIIATKGAFFPKSGKCINLDRAFWLGRTPEGFVHRHGVTLTAMTLREAPWQIQRIITEHTPFVQSYDHRPWARYLEEKCIKVYSEPMDKKEILALIRIARDEGWTLQYREYTKMKIGSGKQVYWCWLFSTRNMVNTIIKKIDPYLHMAWKNLSPIKKMARTSLIFGSWKILESPGHRPFRVGILPIDTKGWALIDKNILRLNGITDDVVKGGLLLKSILRGATHAEMHHMLKKFGVELSIDYISQFDLLIGNEEDKFGVIARGHCLNKISWNPDHTPAEICTPHVMLRWDARLIDGHRPEVDLSEVDQILQRNRMTKEEAVQWLAYKSKDKIDLRMGIWLAYLGFPLNMCTHRILWECIGARVKKMFWKKAPGFTGTILDNRLAPKWLEPIDTGSTKLPPALMWDNNPVKIWRDEGILFIDENIIDNFVRDNDGDLGQYMTDASGFNVDGKKWKQRMPGEIDVVDNRRMPEALADQLGNENYTGWIHSQHMILISIARHIKRTDKNIKMLMNSNRFFTEKFIMRNKYNMEFETPPTLFDMSKKMGFKWHMVKRERAFASAVRNGRLDDLIKLAHDMSAKKSGPFFENIAWQIMHLKLSDEQVNVKDDMFIQIDNVRKHGFKWLKRDTMKRYAKHPKFNKQEFLAGLDARKSMYKIVGPHMLTTEVELQRKNLAVNMDRRFRQEIEHLKVLKLGVNLYRRAEILLATAIVAKEFEYSTYLWNRYWEKEETNYVTKQETV